MKGLDTNILVRYIVQDDSRQAALATSFIEQECTPDSPCFIGHIVLCELAWVLDSNYSQSRGEIALVIEALMEVGELKFMDPDVVWQALRDFKNSNADFSDHLLARANQSAGCAATITFDKKAGGQSQFQFLS